jgi:hypothetical protein
MNREQQKEDLKIHKGYYVSRDGLIYNSKMKMLIGKSIVRINGVNTRRANFIADAWIGKPSEKANVVHIDNDKSNFSIDNLKYKK